MFRSTGSYEPDLTVGTMLADRISFDPQALTSLTHLLRHKAPETVSFDPQALTSLTQSLRGCMERILRFDPQALTSLTSI